VPPLLHPAILETEAAYPGSNSWTLTWLEGRPRCALDDVALVSVDARGAVVVSPASENAENGVPGLHDTAVANSDELDDDWLNES